MQDLVVSVLANGRRSYVDKQAARKAKHTQKRKAHIRAKAPERLRSNILYRRPRIKIQPGAMAGKILDELGI